MALTGIQMCILVAIVAVFVQGAMAQSSCSSTIMSLAPCLGYIQGRSSSPASSCCSQLASVVQSQPQCLCSLLNGGGSQLGITINQTLAMALPGACNVQTPPISRCNGPTPSPAESPVGSPESSPADALTPEASNQPTNSGFPSVSNSKTVPSATSDGNLIKMPLHILLLLFITSIAATTFKT